MDRKPGVNLTLFSTIYVFALMFELLFNREFLAGVIPIGMAASTPVVERVFSIMFVIGEIAFGLVLILQPILVGIAGYYSRINGRGKALIWASLYLSLLLDAVHLYLGYDNTSFNPPVLYSLVYVIILISTVIMVSAYLREWILLFAFIPDVLAYLVLIGNWLIQLSNSSAYGAITAFAGQVMAYAVIVSGAGFVVYALRRGISKKFLAPIVVLAVVIGALVYLNAIPGLGIMIGVVFPYVLGILGVKDWMPPIIFAVAILGLGSAFLLYKKDPAVSLASLALFFGALIFDTVDTTVYLLIPVAAVSILALLRGQKIPQKTE